MLDNWGLSHLKRSGGILESCDRLGNIVRKGRVKCIKKFVGKFLENMRSDERQRGGKTC